MKTRNQFYGLIAIAIIVLAIIGCKEDEPDPVLCKCPNGTLHLVGETCCDGTDCKCEKNVVGQRVQGIPVTSRGGDHTKAIAKFTEALGTNFLTEAEVVIIRNNVREVRVGASGTTDTFGKENGKYTIIIPENAGSTAISNLFYDILDDI